MHPLANISALTMRWNVANNMAGKGIDHLTRSSQLQDIVDDPIASDHSELSQTSIEVSCTSNETAVRDIWLRPLIKLLKPLALKYLHL